MHSSLCSDFVGLFSFFLLNCLLITATQTSVTSLFVLMSFYYPAFLQSCRTLLCPHGLSRPSQVLGQHSRSAEGGWLKTLLKPAQLHRSVLNNKLPTRLHRKFPVQTWFTKNKRKILCNKGKCLSGLKRFLIEATQRAAHQKGLCLIVIFLNT